MNGQRRRRHGPMGGVLLVLLGVLFLWHEFHPEIRAWHLLARWWPLLLILWGVARLIDNMAARRSGTAPGPMLTGGEIFLFILLICAAGVITKIPANFRWPEGDPPFGHRVDVTEELPAKAMKAGSEILIQTQRGDVSVNGTDDTEIRVVAKKSAFDMDEDTARKHARAVSVRLVETPRGYEIRPESGDWRGSSARADLEVCVPKGSVVTAKTESGDVHVCDIADNVDAQTGRGTLEVCNAGGDVHADIRHGDVRILTAKGNVRLTGSGSEVEIDDVTGDASVEGEFYGPIRARNVGKGIHFVSSRTDLGVGTLPGRMEMDSGNLSMDDASGNIQLSTREKDVVLENITGRLRVENKRGEVTVRMRQAPKEDLSISNESGGVELALPASAGFEVDAVSRSGEVSSDFDDPDLKTTDDGHGNSTLRGKHGAKGPRIELRTSYGQIRLRKSD